MKAAYDAGINFFDCAEAYSDGKSEEVVGQCIKKYGYVLEDFLLPASLNRQLEAE